MIFTNLFSIAAGAGAFTGIASSFVHVQHKKDQSQILSLRKERKKNKQKRSLCMSKVLEQKSIIFHLEKEKKHFDKKLKELKNKWNRYENNIDILNDNIYDHETDILNLKLQLSKLQGEKKTNNDLIEKNHFQEIEINRLTKQLENLNNLRRKKVEKKTQYWKMISRNGTLTTEIEDLKEFIRKKTNKLVSHKASYWENRREIVNLKEKIIIGSQNIAQIKSTWSF